MRIGNSCDLVAVARIGESLPQQTSCLRQDQRYQVLNPGLQKQRFPSLSRYDQVICIVDGTVRGFFEADPGVLNVCSLRAAAFVSAQ